MNHSEPPRPPQMPQAPFPPQVPAPPQAQQQSATGVRRRQRVERQGRSLQRPVVQPAMAAPAHPSGAAPTPSRTPTAVSGRLAHALASARAWARPATTGVRLAAFAIDLLVVVVSAAVAWIATSSVFLGILTGLEVVVILTLVEARTGLTAGNAAMRIRTVRDDAPYSPGVARAAVRALVNGAGSLIALVGGFVVVATSSADPMRMGRSWADRAGRTLVVRVPTRADREAWAQGAEAWAAQSGAQAPTYSQAAPAVVPERARARRQLVAPVAVPSAASHVAQPSSTQLRPVQVEAVERERSNTGTTPPPNGLPAGVVPVDSPVASPPPVRQVVTGEQLLLTFDTGQRVQLPIPVMLNLGRKPDPSDAEDQLCVVEDPDSSVSKTHLRLECRGESVWLTDLGSTNGSALLDETGEASPLIAGSRMRLEDGCRVKLGNRSFTVATVVGELPTL